MKELTLNSGTIAAGEVYTLEEFKRRTGLKKTAMQSARQRGLKVTYLHNRAYVYGQHYIDYLLEQGTTSEASEELISA